MATNTLKAALAALNTKETLDSFSSDHHIAVLNSSGEVVGMASVDALINATSGYIDFADAAVEEICIANFSSDGVGVTYADAKNVTSIGTLFKGNTEITSFDELKYFTGVTSLSGGAFSGCTGLMSIDLRNIKDCSSGNQFQGCTSLTTARNMKNMGSGSGKKNGGYVFAYCSKLTSVNFSGWTGNASSFNSTGMIRGCTSLTEVDMSGTILMSGSSWNNAFNGCTGLVTLNLGEVDTSNVSSLSGTWYKCTALENLAFIGLGGNKTKALTWDFSACPLTAESAQALIEGAVDRSDTATYTATHTIKISSTTVSNLGDDFDTFKSACTAKGYTLTY